jgi:hypothetical protein
MNFVTAWLRLELPRRWRSVAVLALLVAVASGTVMAAVAGARRGASALERLQDRTLPATAAIYPNTPNFDWDKVRALPEVQALTTFLLDYTMSYEGYPDEIGPFLPTDTETLRSIETPVVIAGRMYDPARADELVVTRKFAESYGKGVGDTVVMTLPTPRELEDQAGSGPDGAYTGPRPRMTIVGIVISPWFSDEPGVTGHIQVSPGVVTKYPENLIGPTNNPNNAFNYVSALVRLRGGEAALSEFNRDMIRISGRTDLEITNLPGQLVGAQRGITFEARCLSAFAAAALVAALFLVGQAVARYTAASTAELRALVGVGLAPTQVVVAASIAPMIAGVVGGAVGVAAAYLASSYFPFGTADLFESAPGRSADWVVFGAGLVAVAVLVAAGASVSARMSVAAARRDVAARRSTVATAAARWGLPVPVVVGTRFALEAGRGRTAVPVRPALIGAVAGVLGIVAAFTFSQGVADASSRPERFGQTFQLNGFLGANGEDFVPADKIVSAASASPDVAGIDDARQAIATEPDGSGSIVLYTYTAGEKSIPVVLTAGRLPTSAAEVVLAPRTLEVLHARVGSRVQLRGDKGTAGYTVTGSGLVPNGPRNGYAEGGWVLPSGYGTIFSGFKFHMVFVQLRHGADVAASSAALTRAIAAAAPEAQGYSFEAPDPPVEIAAIRQVKVLPIVLGGFLALLAVGAVGHALATAVRRRAHDVAVLRALGMTQGQCRWMVVTQGSVLAVVGLLFGVPLGLATGRVVWRAVADITPLQYVSPTAAWALLIVGPAALVLANVLAAIPGRRAARLRISHILRTE